MYSSLSVAIVWGSALLKKMLYYIKNIFLSLIRVILNVFKVCFIFALIGCFVTIFSMNYKKDNEKIYSSNKINSINYTPSLKASIHKSQAYKNDKLYSLNNKTELQEFISGSKLSLKKNVSYDYASNFHIAKNQIMSKQERDYRLLMRECLLIFPQT
jgi:hypothetical protein